MDMGRMAVENMLLDIFAIILSMFPIVYVCVNRRYKNQLNFFFLGVSVSNVCMTIGDIADWIFQNPADLWQKIILSAFTAFYYVSSAFVLYFFAQYIIAYVKPKGVEKRLSLIIVKALCTIQIIFALISPFTGAIYYVTDNGYQRGPLFLISQIIPLFCYLLFATLIFAYRKKLKRREIIFFILYIFVPLSAGTVQMLFRGIAIVNMGVSLALLFILVNIQFEHEIAMKEQEKKLAEQHVDIMLSQIQPHFLYNSLGTIYHLCETSPETARKAIEKFSEFLRGNMDSLKNREPIAFRSELNHVTNYLYLEQQRFGDKLQIIYQINTENFMIPPLTLQPLVENAVQHGVLNRKNGGTIIIRSEETDEYAVVTVADNGVGIEKAMEHPTLGDHAHIGISNVRSRLEEMVDGSLEIESGDCGTTAVIRIPWTGGIDT